MECDVDCHPKVFRRLRKNLAGISPDSMRKIDQIAMRGLAMKSLIVCEYLAAQLSGRASEFGPEVISSLELQIERFP